MGYASAAIIIAGILLVALSQHEGNSVANTFFTASAWRKSFPEMLPAFWINVWVAVVAQVFVLIFGLVLAIMRMLPGRAGAPLRGIALVYCDVFRAIPAIVVIFLVVFGVPLAFPATGNWPGTWLGIVALTMTYSAYVAEVYRAGLASIHPSQSAAARSLGLSYTQTLRTVLVPQAVRRVIPPLLNDFISLQKDTALVGILGAIEANKAAEIFSDTVFNYSSYVVAAILFLILTIPLARFTDHLIARDRRRRLAGATV